MKRLVYLLSGILLAAARPAAAQTPAPADGRTLEFIPNQGQWASSVRYSGAVPGGHLHLEPGGLRYVLLQPIRHAHGHAAEGGQTPHLPAADSLIRGHQLRVHFVGADARTPLVPAEATGEVRNYLHGNDPAHWASGVPGYRQVRYQAPWPGIGARFYENKQRQLEYDFELEAGADPARIKLKYDGATRLALGADGRLHVGTTLGELTELAPQAYQTDPASGERHAVACRYRLRAQDSTVTFELGRYDRRRPLVIDPTVLFSTYTGATGDNWGFTATYDAAGNMYSGGIVLNYSNSPTGFPVSTGAFQTTFGAIIDMAFIKYNTAVNGAASRVWATYVGGDSYDFPSSIVVNSQNELILLGTSASSNYPTSSAALQRGFAGGTPADPFGDGGAGTPASPYNFYNVLSGTDIVVTRLTSNGGSLAASTYLGGTGTDGLVPFDKASAVRQLPQNYGDAFRGDVNTDAAGNIYVASVTSSTNFPVTPGSFGPLSRGGSSDAVVVKMPASLSSLTWSGYLGGSAADAAYSLQLDASGNVYVAGGTLSANFPATAGAVQTTTQGNVDGFVARIAANGSSVQRATYLGTGDYDQAYFLQIGADGGVYLLGQSLGSWPVTAGVYSNAGSHQFIQKLSADLDQRLLSTVFGSGRATIDISPTAFLVDQCDRVYVCGWGGTINRPFAFDPAYLTAPNGYTHGMAVTPNAVRGTPDTPNAGSDFYLAQFTPGLTGLLYATYYGNAGAGSTGDHVDGGTSRFDPRGVVYSAVCSCTDATGFPVPPGAFTYSATNNSGNCNNAAFKLNFEPQSVFTGGDVTVCLGAAPVVLVGLPAGGSWTGPGVSGSLSAGYVFTPTAALVGLQVLTYTLPGVVTACTITGTKNVTVALPPQVAAPALPAICAGAGPMALTGATPAGGIWSGPGVAGSASGGYTFTPTQALVGTQTLTYSVTTAAGCVGRATTTLTVTPGPLPIVMAADTSLCPGSRTAFQLRATPAGGVWSGPGISASGVFTPPSAPGSVVVTYTVAPGAACQAARTRRITLLPDFTLAPSVQPVLCSDSLVAQFAASAVVPYTVRFSQPNLSGLADATLTWDFGDSSPIATGFGVTHTYTTPGTFQVQATLRYNSSRCATQVAMAPIRVMESLIPNIFTPNGDRLNEYFAPRIGGCPPRLQVFSRWGQLVYESAAYRNTWDGHGLAEGVYYYLLTPPNGGSILKGWVELVR
jgi:gliding motility-associated-like protein